jgi:beta-lactamase class D
LWLDNSLKISGDEQLGLVKKLYFGQLPFQPRSQRMVKNMMKREENSNYLLSYKTGTGKLENGHLLGWNIGWIEENRHPYFYILQLESDDANYQMDAHREKMLKDILKQYGFMEGKR